MDISPNTSSHIVRPILSLPATSDFVPTAEFNIVKKLTRDGSIDLKQQPLDQALKEITNSDKKWLQAHVAVAVCAYKDLFVMIKTDNLPRREKQLDEELQPGDRRGHHLYRYFVGVCKFARPKSSKLATYLQARIHDGLTPAQLETKMLDSWRLERGYEEALLELEGAETSPKTSNKGHKQSEQSSRSSDDDDDPPRPAKAGRKARASEQEEDDEEDKPKRSNKKSTLPPPLELVGSPRTLAGERKSFAIVRFSVKGKPLKITFMSPKHAKARAEHYLGQERKAKRRDDKAA